MEKTKFEKKPWYANIRDAERAIWERFIDKYPDAYDEVAYNVKVGEGSEIPEGTEENLAKGFKELTQHKIDVVGFKGDRIDIIELKDYAGTRAIGQVIGYRRLFNRGYNPSTPPSLVIITDVLRADTKIIAEEENIKIIVV